MLGKVAVELQYRGLPAGGPTLRVHMIVSKVLLTKKWAGIRCQRFQDILPRQDAFFGVGLILLLSCGTSRHTTEPSSTLGNTTGRNPAHTVSVLGRVTGSKCFCGEVTGRKARSMTGLEKSGKILCCCANLQVKIMSVK